MATMEANQETVQLGHVAVRKSLAAERNKEPILGVLRSLLHPATPQRVLELASGTGQHLAYFSEHLSHVTWQPSECDASSLQSIGGYVTASSRSNLLAPVIIDAAMLASQWAGGCMHPASYDAVLCINVVHISHWSVTEGIFRGSSYYLKPNGLLILYGPMKIHGVLEPESNVKFDQMLRQQCADWGVRDVDDLGLVATTHHLRFLSMHDMPSNNKVVVYQKLSSNS